MKPAKSKNLGLLSLIAAAAATPLQHEQDAQMALLTREAYEAENGTGSYPRLVLSMLSVMDSSATLSEALRMSWRAGAGSAIEHGLICAEDMTRDFMAAFVVYTQATRIEVEEAARKLRIANLDVFLNEHRPTNDMFPGYEHLTL